MKFPEILMQERKKRGLSQEDLAGKINVSRQAISKWENGDSFPDVPKLIALSDALDVSMDNLCGREQLRENLTIKNNKKQIIILIGAILLGCLFGFILQSWRTTPLPDVMEVSNVSVEYSNRTLKFACLVSAVNNGYDYELAFSRMDATTKTYDLRCVEGYCQTQFISDADIFHSVYVIVSNGKDRRTIPVFSYLDFSGDNVIYRQED